MANLMISAVCNQRCPYCFTLDYQQSASHTGDFIDIADFDARLDVLERSGIDTVRLMGGEPTLHPGFVELVRRAIDRGKTVSLFTNGLMPEPALAYLESLPVERCTVLVNVNMPGVTPQAQHDHRLATLRRLGKRTMLGFNMYRTDGEMDFLCATVTETGCQPVIRMGIAHPCLSGNNDFVHPKQYGIIGQTLVRFAGHAARFGITLDFDCGFVRCMFSEQDLAALERAGAKFGWHCNPILDIDIAGNVTHCYPLATLWQLPLASASDVAVLRSAFDDLARPYRAASIYPECARCGFKARGECTGGCLAATIRRFRHTPFTITVPPQEAR